MRHLAISVLDEAYDKLKVEFQRRAYQEHPVDKIILELIEGGKMSADEIVKELYKKHSINRRANRIVNMAKRIGIDLG